MALEDGMTLLWLWYGFGDGMALEMVWLCMEKVWLWRVVL